MSQVLHSDAGFYEPVAAVDFTVNRPPLVHSLWDIDLLPYQQVLDPSSPPRSRTRSTTSSSSELRGRQRPLPPRQGTNSSDMEGFDDDSQQANSTAASRLYLDGAPPPQRSVKRPRPVKSCLECRKRKLKCDRALPCLQCQKSHRMCKYAPDGQSGGLSDGDSDEGERAPKRPLGNGSHDSQNRPPVPLVASYLNGSRSSPNAPPDEMAIRLERLEKMLMEKHSPADHISPASTRRSTYPQHFPLASATIRTLSVKDDTRTRFFGQNSPKVLLNLFEDARDFMRSMPQTEGFKELFTGLQNVYKALQAEYRKGMEPVEDYMDATVPLQKRMSDLLPARDVCDRLLDSCLVTGEGLFRVVHIPSIRKEYQKYWEGEGCAESFLPRLLCMLAIASRFEAGSKMLTTSHSDCVHAPTASSLVRSWLDSLKGKQLVDLNTLQTELLLLHAERSITPRHQDSWARLGFVVRMAMTMGLHRDPSEFPSISVFQGEMRRRLWYTIIEMDLHVAIACNLPCAVREGEYSCAPPRNLDDMQLSPDMKVLPDPQPMDQFTSNQLQAYAASTITWRMRVSSVLSRLDSVREYAEVLEIGNRLERLLDDTNCLFPRYHTSDPQQRYMEWRLRFYLDAHVRRPLVALYRPFALSTPSCPHQISNAYLKSSMAILTYMDELDPNIPGYDDILHRYQLFLKQDIIQAAFSLCYYIKNSPDTGSNAKPNSQWMPNMSPAPSETSSQVSTEARMIWSTSVLVKAVERALDMLILMVQDSTSNLREIVALTIVLHSVQTGSAQQKRERIKAGVRRILENMIEILNTKTTGAITAPAMLAAHAPPGTQQHQQQQQNHQQQQTQHLKHDKVPMTTADMFATTPAMNLPFNAEDFFQINVSDEFPVWDNFMDYWNPTTFSMDGPQ